MKFVKVTLDGKEYYQLYEEGMEGEIVEGEIEQSDSKGGAKEFFDRVGSGMRDFGESFVNETKKMGGKIADGMKAFGKKVKESPLFSAKQETTEEKLLKLLPYMDTKSTHEVSERLITNDETVKNLDIATVMPFFAREDCDALFLTAIERGNGTFDMEKVAPYVSAGALKKVVDGYIAGEYPELNMDLLYPYLKDADIKRIFYHIVGKEA